MDKALSIEVIDSGLSSGSRYIDFDYSATVVIDFALFPHVSSLFLLPSLPLCSELATDKKV